MSNRMMYIIAFSVYLLFVAAFVALYLLCQGNPESLTMGMYFLSSGLMGVTMILAVIFLKDKQRQTIAERFEMERHEEDGWDKKE